MEPHYAIKSCPNEVIIELLARLGCGFDCASKGEILQVMKHNVRPERIIYANPVKQNDYITFAGQEGVHDMTFDCEEELHKIKQHHPNANMILRIKTDDSHSVCKFSTKFGCSVKEATDLIKVAKDLEIKVVGVSFHVGSKCLDSESYVKAIKDARDVFNVGKKYGMNMYLLDIGGGFPGSEGESLVSFDRMASAIEFGIENYFKDIENLKIISEPGRYFCSKSHTLVCNVIGKKKKTVGDETKYLYYINEGVYGGFNCLVFDDAHPQIKPLHVKNNTPYKSTVFGPTCDSLDKIGTDIDLPELNVGDICYVENFGAYTKASSSHFNGFGEVIPYYYIKC